MDRTDRILVVDDEMLNRELLLALLEGQGHEGLEAENGREALDVVRQEPVDLIILDVMMPVMTGIQALEYLKADPELREIPVVMLSALTEIELIAQCIKMGAEDFLPKPLNAVVMRARIDACLERKHQRDREVEYFKTAAKVTEAAAAVERDEFDPASLADVAERQDPLGQLARVFINMAEQVEAREQQLKKQVQQLRIEIDESRKERQVAEITESDYFQQLQQRAQDLRHR